MNLCLGMAAWAEDERQEGREEGRQEARRDVANNMFANNMDINMIAELCKEHIDTVQLWYKEWRETPK